MPKSNKSQGTMHKVKRPRSTGKSVRKIPKREPEVKNELQPKKNIIHELRLTKFELLHVRDLFSVMMPTDLKKTISQSLAELESRSLIESALWKKISEACAAASIPMDEYAPDYVIAPVGPPALSVFHLASEPQGTEEHVDNDSFLNTAEED
jgi:hypothetical protein